MIVRFPSEEQKQQYRAAYPAVRERVQKELTKRIRAAGMTPGKSLSKVDDATVDIEFQPFSLPSYRTTQAMLQDNGEPLVQVTVGRYGRKLTRRMKVDGSFPYDEVVAEVKRQVESHTASVTAEKERKDAKQRMADKLAALGLQFTNSMADERGNPFSGDVSGSVQSWGSLEVRLRYDADVSPERLQRLLTFLTTEFPKPAPEGGDS